MVRARLAAVLSLSLALLLSLFLCLPFLGASALGEGIVEADGVRYELTRDQAVIVGFSAGAEVARLPARFQGLPTAAPEDQPLGEVPELILEEGITSREPYLGLRNARIRRVTLPGTLVLFPEKERTWLEVSWMDCFPWLEQVTFPANLSREDFDRFLAWEQAAYWCSSDELWAVAVDFWDDSSLFVSDISFRWLSHVRIPPDHPSLYDIDGVVFDKATDELLACMPGRFGAYAVPEGTTGIGKEAFAGCDRLEWISLPRSVSAIGEAAFSGCASLRTLGLPPTLRDIGAYAFLNCLSLDALILPDGVRVGARAFEYCTGLKSVYSLGMSSAIDPSAFRTASPDLVIYAPKDSAGYQAAAANDLLWAEFDGEPVRLSDPAWIQTAVVHDQETSGLLPLYERADEASPVLARYPVGSTAKVLGTANGWAHVAFAEGEGYMPLESLHLVSKTDIRERVLCVGLEERDGAQTLYAAPSLSAPTVIAEEWRYGVVQRYGTWYLLERGGETYYVPVSEAVPYSMCVVSPWLYVVGAKGEGSRTRLYAQPDKYSQSLGVFYNGTQVEAIKGGPQAQQAAKSPEATDTVPATGQSPGVGEENEDPEYEPGLWSHPREINGFYHVRVDGQEGYMEKDALLRIWAEWFYDGD